MTRGPARSLPGLEGVLWREVATRVAEASHSTADPTRPPEGCVPPACTPTPPAPPVARATCSPCTWSAPHRLPPGHDLAVPPWPVHRHHRRPAGLPALYGAPLGPPLQHQRHQRAVRPTPPGPAPAWQPPAGPAHPAPARRPQEVDDRPAPPAAGSPRHEPADPAPARPRGGRLAAAPPGRQGRPRPRADPGRPPPALSDLPDGAVVLAEDETHVNLLPWVRATWIPHGTRQQVMTPGTNRRRTIFGAVELATGRLFYQVTRKAVSACFTAFLAQLLAAYPAAPVVAVVCDNVIHPPLQDRPALASRPPPHPGAARGTL